MTETHTEARCRAPHPDGVRNPRFAGQMCNAKLGDYPWEMAATKQVFARQDQVPEGEIGLPCGRCGMVTVFHFVRWIGTPPGGAG